MTRTRTSRARGMTVAAAACAVADAWAALAADREILSANARRAALAAALDRLEAVTRPSAVRKVRP